MQICVVDAPLSASCFKGLTRVSVREAERLSALRSGEQPELVQSCDWGWLDLRLLCLLQEPKELGSWVFEINPWSWIADYDVVAGRKQVGNKD